MSGGQMAALCFVVTLVVGFYVGYTAALLTH